MAAKNRYSAIIEAIFHGQYESGADSVDFRREQITAAAISLGVDTPRNLGDVIYTFRYRQPLPASIRAKAPPGKTWIIRAAGSGRYRFVLVADIPLIPNLSLAVTKIPDATPGMVGKYAFSDEQAVLARVRYNRLIDVFLGIACGSNMIGRVQIEQDIAVCAEKLPSLVCRPVGAYVTQDDVVALLEFEEDESEIRVANERHYKLVPPEAVTAEDLARYQQRLSGQSE